jgi:hypothetical protein
MCGSSRGEVRAKSASAEDLAELIRDLTAQVVQSSSEAAALRERLQLTERLGAAVAETSAIHI